MLLFFVLWQVIHTFPPLQLELPLCLLCRLLMCDTGRSVSRLKSAACGFLTPPKSSWVAAAERGTPQTRTASSLLSELLGLNEMWDSVVELLTLLSQVAKCSRRDSHLKLHLEASVLSQALAHPEGQVRAAACRLLGNLDPFMPAALYTLQPAIFKSMTASLHDSCMSVRRMACRAVGSWLGYIVSAFNMGPANGKGSDTAGWGKDKRERNRYESKEEGVGDKEAWIQEARRTVAMLASLLTDPDALTRRHCCAALGNLASVDGARSSLMDEDVSRLLLRAACSDTHNSVRQAAVATLCLYSRQDPLREVKTDRGHRKSTLQDQITLKGPFLRIFNTTYI